MTLVLAFALLLGLVVGSFANVLIHRLPRRLSIVAPGSRCPACGRPIPWYLNVPVLSWVVLRGRCAGCRSPISLQYPAVEAAMGGLFLLCAWRWGLSVETAAACVFCSLCLPLAIIDLKHQILPDRLTFPGILAGLAFSFFTAWTRPLDSLAGALLGAALPAALILLYGLFGVEAMGWGDVKLLAMVGAFLGWRPVLLTLFGGALLGTVLGGGYLLLARKGRRTPLPFGTFLCAAALASLFLGQALLRWYAGFLVPGP